MFPLPLLICLRLRHHVRFFNTKAPPEKKPNFVYNYLKNAEPQKNNPEKGKKKQLLFQLQNNSQKSQKQIQLTHKHQKCTSKNRTIPNKRVSCHLIDKPQL